MTGFYLALLMLFLSGQVDGYWGWGGFGWRLCTCGWRYGGECRETCDTGDYVLGPGPCAFGRYGVCCAKTLPCSAYGGMCQEDGCRLEDQVEFEYKVTCPSTSQTCCLRTAINASFVSTYGTDPTPTVVPRRCPPPLPWLSSRILGGAPVNSVCQWPWMVSISLGTAAEYDRPLCAGILLSDTRVLTTASCAQGNDLLVTFGESDVRTFGQAGETTIPVVSRKLHPDYIAADGPQEADLAILTLNGQAPESDCVSPACLPWTGTVTSNTGCRIAAWGVNGVSDGQLHEASVNVLTNEVCDDLVNYFGQGFITGVPEDKLCSFPLADATDACVGDNGGMLVCEDTEGNWILKGIISDHACSRRLPVLYTGIELYLDWINEHL